MWSWKLLTFLHATLNYRPGTILFFTYKIICYFSLPFSRCEIWSSKGLLTCPRTQLPNAEQRFKSRHSGSNLYSKPLYIYTCTTRLREGNGSPLWCSCLENPRDGGAWWVAVYGVAQSRTRLKRLSSISTTTIRLQILPSNLYWNLSGRNIGYHFQIKNNTSHPLS